VQGELSDLKTVVVLDTVDQAPSPLAVLPASDLLAAATPLDRPDPQPTDIHAGIFTSGTTGQSKCALVTWGTLEDSGRWLLPTSSIEERHTGAYYNPWPDYHALGLAGFPAAVQRGLRLVLRPTFSVGDFWKDIRTHECTHTVLLVTAPLLLDQPVADDDGHNPLEHVTIVPATGRVNEFQQRFAVRTGSIYGMTETGPIIYTDRAAEHQGGGCPVPGLELEIRTSDDRIAEPNQLGQLVVRPEAAWRLSKSYLGLPEEMGKRWQDGWFHTGDAFVLDPDDRYHFVDRLKDCVRMRGHNVSSIEVEVEVGSHPAVVDCACVGVQSDSAFGEEDIMIYVVPRPGGSLDEADLHRYLTERLPRFMLPRFIELVPDLPRTPTLKVRKDILRSLGPTASAWVSG
jgi:crotonobetaine/carnitine-CoA ligase